MLPGETCVLFSGYKPWVQSEVTDLFDGAAIHYLLTLMPPGIYQRSVHSDDHDGGGGLMMMMMNVMVVIMMIVMTMAIVIMMISHSSQCSTTGVTNAVVCVILSVV